MNETISVRLNNIFRNRSQIEIFLELCETVNRTGGGYGSVTVVFHNGSVKECATQFTMRPTKNDESMEKNV
jgi:hypothetical protein